MPTKKIIWFILGLLAAFALVKAVTFFTLETDKINPVYLIPEDAIFFMELDEPVDNLETLSKSEIWDHLQTNEAIRELSAKVNGLDSVFQSQNSLFELIGDRDVIISAHMIKSDDYGFLYVVDLDKLSRLGIIKNNINQLINDDFKVTKRTYKEVEITEIKDQSTYETLYLAAIENQLIASYYGKLVEKSINAFPQPKIGTDLQFLELQQKLKKDGLFRLYLNHKQLENYYTVFSNESSDMITKLQDYGNYSGFIFDEDDDRLLTATGFTAGNSVMQSLALALDNSGTGSVDAITILPQQTAFYLSFGFDDFNSFHDSFYDLLEEQQPDLVKKYHDEKKNLEQSIDINLEDDFYSWVDDEIAFAMVAEHSRSKANHKELNTQEGIAVVFKTKDVDDSKKKLKFIESQIRKKTPVKFKSVNYKNYEISYLDIKGFFRLIAGSLFDQIEKPYYTIIDEFVVFSNSPKTLKVFIDDYENEQTLIYDDYYRAFLNEFSNSSNLFLYVNTNELATAGTQFLNAESRKLITQNQDFYSQFTQLGMEFKASDDLFKTKTVMHYDASYDLQALELEERTKDLPLDLVTIKKEEFDKATIFNIEIFPNDFTAKDYTQKHVNGRTKFKVNLKDGLPNGRYREYYMNGDLKISGRYRDGEQVGTWKYFTRDGKMYYKKRF